MPVAAPSAPPTRIRASHSVLNTPVTGATATDANKIPLIRGLEGAISTRELLLPADNRNEKTRAEAGFLYS
jgi:hypothetical protein